MKTQLAFITLMLTIFGCASRQRPKDEKNEVTKTEERKDRVFKQISDFPIILDTSRFIADLRDVYGLEVDESFFYQKGNEKITSYQKLKIYGSDKDYFFIEYDYGDGAGAAFPWKYQLLLSPEGKLVKTLSGLRYEFVEIFENENPFLLTVIATDKGNGWHELFKITADTLENVYEGYLSNVIRTYDAHQDSKIYEPYELVLKVKDFNNDGFNDISFVGKIVFIQGQTRSGDWFDSEIINGTEVTYSVDNPFKKVPIEFIFLYDKETGHFKSKENYTEKYGLND